MIKDLKPPALKGFLAKCLRQPSNDWPFWPEKPFSMKFLHKRLLFDPGPEQSHSKKDLRFYSL